MIGSDFQIEKEQHGRRCSECGKFIRRHEDVLVARNKKGNVAKVVCSEDCRLTFDDRVWQDFADRNNR